MDGIIIVNKEKGYTSNDVVRKVKKILKCHKVGHTGTLDPNATGVLPLLLDRATKISSYLINHQKEYEAVLQLGVKTTTADEEGDIVEKREITPELLEEGLIQKVLQSFVGKIQQIPPIYSAIKVDGKKLYQYARQGKTVQIPPREIEILRMNLLSIDPPKKQICFNVKCSKGTYIRTLCEDIAKKLGTVGYMKELKRISVGDFHIKDAVSIDDLENKEIVNSKIITIEQYFQTYSEIVLKNEQELKNFFNGVLIAQTGCQDGVYRIYFQYNFLGTGIVKQQQLKRDILIIDSIS